MHGLIFSGVPREVPECVSGRVLAVIAEAIHEELPRRIFEGIHRRILQDFLEESFKKFLIKSLNKFMEDSFMEIWN